MTDRPLLRMLAGVTSALTGARNRLFDDGWSAIVRLERPVISIGNLTVGGTGKTPVTRLLAEELLTRNKRVALISRNYKAQVLGPCRVDPTEARGAAWYGDEPFWLARALPRASVFVGPSKSETAQWALRQEPDLDVFLIDDGFQHRRLARDWDLVLVDATDEKTFDPWPLGRARESREGLRRADLILLTKCNWISADRLAQVRSALPSGVPVFEVEFEMRWPPVPPAVPLGIFAGIARPEIFFEQARRRFGGQVRTTVAFRDHQAYGSSELAKLKVFLDENPSAVWLTTEKDAIKIQADVFGDRLQAAGLRARLRSKEGFFEKLHAVVG